MPGLMSASLRRLPLLIATLSLLVASATWAQAKPDAKAAAKEHYTRGTSYYDLGRYDDAIKEFEAAYHLKKDAAILFNLAQANRLAGNGKRALNIYRTYVRNHPNGPNREEAEERIKALEAEASAPPTAPPPAITPPPPVTTPPPPATAPPHGETPPPADKTPPTVTVTPPPPTTLPPPTYPPPGDMTGPPPPINTTPPAAPDPGRKFRIAGIATGGAGAALILIGMIQGARAVGAANDIEDAAKARMAFDPEVERRGQSAENAQWWCLGLGLVAGAGGAALWYYGKRVTAAAETTTWRVSLAPVVAPSINGATLRITF
jgi:tetratricopeptide (TPR) repeat protein